MPLFNKNDYNRERKIMSDRLKQQFEFESLTRKMKEEANRGLVSLNQQFSKADTQKRDIFKDETIGLVSAKNYKEKQNTLKNKRQKPSSENEEKINFETKKAKIKNVKSHVLSFDIESEESDQSENYKKKNIKKKSVKNPNVDTSFLPDKERDEKEKEQRENLKNKWLQIQEKIKLEKINLTYLYWDGSGHRRNIIVEKGNTIGQFLEKVKESLSIHFVEFRAVSLDNILYVKDDLIIPHSLTFHDLIMSKKRGRTTELFIIEEKTKIRTPKGELIEIQKDESHSGKVVIRSWYERNRHLLPASMWEVFEEKTE